MKKLGTKQTNEAKGSKKPKYYYQPAFCRDGITYEQVTNKAKLNWIPKFESQAGMGGAKVELGKRVMATKMLFRMAIWEASLLNIQKAFFLYGFSTIRVKSMGDNVVLLSREEKDNLKEIINENKDQLDQWFDSFSQWELNLVATSMLVWIILINIPLNYWNEEGL